MSEKRVAIAYIPVIHRGYPNYLEGLREKGIEDIYIVADDILASHEELDYIHRKDRLRALPHEEIKKALSVLTELRVHSLSIQTIFDIHETRATIYAPREDINTFLMETYFGGHHVEYSAVFLRRHKDNTDEEREAVGEHIEALAAFEQGAMAAAIKEAEKSTDWWRQVGAALVQKGEVVAVAHNEHMSEKELPNIIGDSRALFKKGVNIQYVTSVHAEAAVIAEAARKGIATEGAELFVTDFPCPYCARLITKSGIKKLYFVHGYAVLGGEEFFKEMNIKTVRLSL